MYFIEVCVPNNKREKVTVYVAAICGVDSKYNMKRSFYQPEVDYCTDTRSYLYYLKDGVYEIGFTRYAWKDGTKLERIRYLLILFEGRRYLYPYEELGEEYAMYAAFIFWLQSAGEESAKRMFTRKEGSDHE